MNHRQKRLATTAGIECRPDANRGGTIPGATMSTLNIRLPNSIHQPADRLARHEGASVIHLASRVLAEQLSARDAER